MTKVADISGMGGREFGGYEWGCQVIRAHALRFLQQLRPETPFPEHHGFQGVTGILVSDNDIAKKMDDFILAHPKLKEFGVTGAMHQYGVIHAKKWHELGWDQYERQLREAGRTDDDFFEFNEADAFPEDAK